MTLRNLSADDPIITLDFQKSKYLDPRVTFTRASYAPANDPSSGTGIHGGTLQEFNVNVPRLTDRGLLIEEARTNYQYNSEAFAVNTGWRIKDDYTRGANTTEPAPDGSNTACEFFEVTGGGTYNGVEAASLINITPSSGRLTISVYNKPINCDTFYIGSSSTGQNHANCTSIVNNTWTFNTAFVESAKAEPIGNGWYRMSATMIVPTNSQWYRPLFSSQMFPEPDTPDSSQGCTLWGAQMEEGNFVTSYVPNTGTSGQVTRAQDVCEITNDELSSWVNSGGGTYVTEFNNIGFKNVGSLEMYLNFIQGNSRLEFNLNGLVLLYHNGQTGWGGAGYSMSLNQNNKSALSANFLDGSGSFTSNGKSPNFTPPVASPSGAYNPTRMAFGYTLYQNRGLGLSGYVQRFAYYPTQVSDTAVQALTYSSLES